MTSPYIETMRFFTRLGQLERIDNLSDARILELRDTDFDQVYTRTCKILQDMMFSEFVEHVSQDYYPDLVQAACIGVLKAVNSWNPECGSSITTWAYRLARNAVLDELRRESKWDSCHEMYDLEGETDTDLPTMLHNNDTYDMPEGASERAMQWEAEYDQLRGGLAAWERGILDMLRDGYTQQDIAEMYGTSQATVSRYVAKIQQKLRKKDE